MTDLGQPYAHLRGLFSKRGDHAMTDLRQPYAQLSKLYPNRAADLWALQRRVLLEREESRQLAAKKQHAWFRDLGALDKAVLRSPRLQDAGLRVSTPATVYRGEAWRERLAAPVVDVRRVHVGTPRL